MEKTTMSVQELSAQMGISLPKAYELVKTPAVSYTHLDVYKRQGQDNPGEYMMTGGVAKNKVITNALEEKLSLIHISCEVLPCSVVF